MSLDIDILKKRIIFRASHRGSKEMDMLMKSFTESIIDNLNPNELKILDKLVDLNDEDLLKIKTNKSIKDKIHKLFVEYNFK